VKAPVPTEHDEERTFTEWAAAMRTHWPELDVLYKIPNEAKRSYALMHYLRAEGFVAGMPDRCLPVARGGYHALYIEMKRRSGGRLSDMQRVRADLLRLHGNLVVVAAGADRAIELAMDYLSGRFYV